MTVNVCDLCDAKAIEGYGHVVIDNPKASASERRHGSTYLSIEATYNIEGTKIDLCRKCRLKVFRLAIKELERE